MAAGGGGPAEGGGGAGGGGGGGGRGEGAPGWGRVVERGAGAGGDDAFGGLLGLADEFGGGRVGLILLHVVPPDVDDAGAVDAGGVPGAAPVNERAERRARVHRDRDERGETPGEEDGREHAQAQARGGARGETEFAAGRGHGASLPAGRVAAFGAGGVGRDAGE